MIASGYVGWNSWRISGLGGTSYKELQEGYPRPPIFELPSPTSGDEVDMMSNATSAMEDIDEYPAFSPAGFAS